MQEKESMTQHKPQVTHIFKTVIFLAKHVNINSIILYVNESENTMK